VTADLPAGYLPVETSDARGFALAPAVDWLASILREHGTIRAWADSSVGATLGGGRGPVRVMAAPVRGPDGRAEWVCRPLRRGGALAPLLGDRYIRVGESRPFAELGASFAARARVVRTPAVVAGAAYGRGLVYRGDVVTERVPGARSLAHALFAGGSALAPTTSLQAAGRFVRALEQARVAHRDLSAGNLLVPSTDHGVPELWVVDLDRCRILPLTSGPPPPAMRRRLERSLAKLGRRHARPLTRAEWEALRAGYEQP
jgi:3-deoxy-D-manno-octulosonic acid kinase